MFNLFFFIFKHCSLEYSVTECTPLALRKIFSRVYPSIKSSWQIQLQGLKQLQVKSLIRWVPNLLRYAIIRTRTELSFLDLVFHGLSRNLRNREGESRFPIFVSFSLQKTCTVQAYKSWPRQPENCPKNNTTQLPYLRRNDQSCISNFRVNYTKHARSVPSSYPIYNQRSIIRETRLGFFFSVYSVMVLWMTSMVTGHLLVACTPPKSFRSIGNRTLLLNVSELSVETLLSSELTF